jgi:DNA-binding protein H-NS
VLACIVTATYVHKKTYKHPTDVTWHGKGEKPEPIAPAR